jgi:hypothetical protein
VGNSPHDRLHHVVQRDEADDATELIGYERDGFAALFERLDQPEQGLRLRHDERGKHQVLDLHACPGGAVCVNCLHGHRPDGVIAIPGVNRKVRVVADDNVVPDLFVRVVAVQSDNFGAWGHDFAHGQLIQFQRAVDSPPKQMEPDETE